MCRSWLIVTLIVSVEALIFVGIAGIGRGVSVAQSLLRALLGHRVNVMILEKALELEKMQKQLEKESKEASHREEELIREKDASRAAAKRKIQDLTGFYARYPVFGRIPNPISSLSDTNKAS